MPGGRQSRRAEDARRAERLSCTPGLLSAPLRTALSRPARPDACSPPEVSGPPAWGPRRGRAPPPEPHGRALEFGPFPPGSAPWPAGAPGGLRRPGSWRVSVGDGGGCAGRQAWRRAGTCFDLPGAAGGSERRPWRSLGGVARAQDAAAGRPRWERAPPPPWRASAVAVVSMAFPTPAWRRAAVSAATPGRAVSGASTVTEQWGPRVAAWRRARPVKRSGPGEAAAARSPSRDAPASPPPPPA